MRAYKYICPFTAIIMFLCLQIFYSSLYSQWAVQQTIQGAPLRSISAADNNIVWTCGNLGRVMNTTNGGTNWIETNSPNPDIILFNIWAINASVALVTGSDSNTYVYKTTDGGESWSMVFFQENGFINNIVQYSNNINDLLMQGDPVGERWSIWKSTDMGSTWDSTGNYLPQINTEVGINNSMFIRINSDSYTLWFGTIDSLIHHYNNNNWTTQFTGIQLCASIWFNDQQKGMVGGNTTAYTTNGGNTWIQINSISGPTAGITGEGNHWWYARSDKIYYSSNNGISWNHQFSLGYWFFLHLTKSRTGSSMWAVSGNNVIVTSLGLIGITPISNEVPGSFILYQNYPNPFNPTTNIKFAIAKATDVKLSVYDALGREVETLVNEFISPGIYEVKWDAARFSSGIYFNKILTNEFTSVKKMALIK